MFYFLVFHTSISASKTIDKKLLITLLYGSIMYLILHGLIKSSKYDFFKYIENYYWTIIIIDIVTLLYLTWNVIDYLSIINRFIDTSAYSSLQVNNNINNNDNYYPNNTEPSLLDSMSAGIESINNNIKPILRTNIHEGSFENYKNPEHTKKVGFTDITENNNTSIITTAQDMGLSQSTSLEELGLNDDNNVNAITEPINMQDFFNETIDVTDHVSNISDIDDINLDEFANNLS